jgi:hypothetical protein
LIDACASAPAYVEHLPLRCKMMQARADYLDALRISGSF